MSTNRRTFIKQMGYVSLGFSMLGTACVLDSKKSVNAFDEIPKRPSEEQINAWIRILGDGRIKVLTGKMELGQGIRIAVAQVAAEELNTNIDLVEVNLAETGVTANEGYTAGSRSIEASAMSIRNAAACAREILKELAAKKLKIDKDKLDLKDGFILNEEQKFSFFEILDGQQIERNLKIPPEFKAKASRKIVGQPIKRKDISQMVVGKHTFIQDLRFPGMLHARIIRPPSYTSKLKSINENAFSEKEGFLKLVKIGDFLGVISEEEFQAVQLQREIFANTEWETGAPLPAEKDLKTYIKNLAAEVAVEEQRGDWEKALKSASIQHKASYFKPYIMHAANGPSCAVAIYKDEKLKLWTHSQGVYPLRETLAPLLEMPQENIHIIGTPGSGCYGHNAADDVAAEVALLAKNYPGKHIRLQWMRDEEHAWEPYGTPMAFEMEAGLTPEGKIAGWKYDFWSDVHSTRPGGNPDNLLPARYLGKSYKKPAEGFKGGALRNSIPYYEIADLQTQSHIFSGPLRRSALRSLGAFGNIFAIESFMDELAYKAGKDPIQFRINHSSDTRSIECLEKLQQKINSVKKSKNQGVGVAFSRYKNSSSYCAVAALVEVSEEGEVLVKKMWAVIDAGECINPDGLKNQTEGGMIQAASWTIKEKVLFSDQHIISLDWNSYPIFRFPETPECEVEVIDRVEQPPLGAGESAQGPAGAAVVNAIFDATGIRVRDLPVKDQLAKEINKK